MVMVAMVICTLAVVFSPGVGFAQPAAPTAPAVESGPAALPEVPASPTPAATPAVANATPYDAAVAEAIASTTKDDAVPPTTEELVDAGKKVYNDWAKLGWMAGIAALCGFLLLLLRYKPLDDLLTNKDWKKWKPWVSAVIGAVGGFFSSYMTGVGWMPSIITGVMAGLAIVGLHQGITGVAKPKEPGK
jgi:hypothetical protein